MADLKQIITFVMHTWPLILFKLSWKKTMSNSSTSKLIKLDVSQSYLFIKICKQHIKYI